MNIKRHVAAVYNDGTIRLVTENIPELIPGTIRVRVHASLVSPGTELGGWKQLALAKKSKTAPGEPRKFGYSNAGTVEAVGKGVEQFVVGQRVACIGYGFALHSDYAVIPQNLCVPLPDTVTYEQGSYAMLLATAMQAVRRAQPELGERVAVVGMGLVGQLTAQLHQVSGNNVIGWARNTTQVDAANSWGIDQVIDTKTVDPVIATQKFTKNRGLDTAVLAFPGEAGDSWLQILESMKITPDGHRMGRAVIVGGSQVNLKWVPANMDVRFAARTGPGYHDDAWELGAKYPPVLVPWTTQSNLELGMELIEQKKVNVDALTSHRVNLFEVTETIDQLIEEPSKILGLVFEN